MSQFSTPLAEALADVDRAQASARSHMPDGTLGSFPTTWELATLRILAEAARGHLARRIACKCCTDNECECDGRKAGYILRNGEIEVRP